jgi:diguanylate cyclase (GGDEF)-like protein
VRILIADDDVTSRAVLSGVLAKFGHEVLAVTDGLEALEALRHTDAPRLAILDWVMPRVGGLDVCRSIRAQPSDQPPYIIVLTSKGGKEDIVEALEAGADDYLAKPFDPGELRARVGVGVRTVELQRHLAETRAALAHEAMHDPLTGALNRRAFGETLAREISEVRRHDHGLALGVCDIDHFKVINDTHGHLIGDEVLCALVRLIEGHLRAHDILGRHGGDEFVILTAHTSAEAAATTFERIRSVVAGTPIATSVGDIPISISIGIRAWHRGETDVELLAAADAALYRAKEAGRDRVYLARPA